VHVWTKINRL
jgi:cytoskeleton-associated protein 5